MKMPPLPELPKLDALGAGHVVRQDEVHRRMQDYARLYGSMVLAEHQKEMQKVMQQWHEQIAAIRAKFG